ncbi:hypothetical protein T440DRAFT_273655 [Plenodomus tracheiphilus IPT5]|uniref:Extracellular membrane protein CFEM domain-containing protein n=1 Tax=Plenodomus tracheiphilus IPT5 TaxID=1408161 RepID=A0A6A7BG62_9PLEO|nr:hypothetical protein T440DRAFT_273655 [Plenodomus tracheiphilus IPT5]
MLFQKLAIVSALTALVAGQDIGPDDIPVECGAVCGPVIALSRGCDATTNDDATELNCICTAPNANTLVPFCDACVAQFRVPDNDDNDDNDDNTPDVNDVREVLTRCSFTTTSFNTASASAALSSITQSLGSNRPNATPSGGSVITTTSGSVVLTTSVAAATSTIGQQTVNAAPAHTAGAAIGLGALGFALGML